MKGLILRSVARIVPTVRGCGVRVLLYHAVGAPDAIDSMALRVDRAVFVQQMTVLATEGYRIVPLRDVGEAGDGDGSPRVAITFDDGYRSMAWAAGVLKDLGFPATFFVIAGFADRARPPRAYWETWGHLGWTDLARLVNDGFELGAHSVTHPDLTHCSDGQLHEEVDGARRLLEGRLGVGVSSFSYPYGRHDARVRRAVQAAGFRLACTSTYGRNDVLKSPYEVRRTEISGRDDAADFRAKLEGRYDWLRYWQRLPGLRSAPAR